MIDTLMNHLHSSVLHRVWIFSDLQQSDPIKSRQCLTQAIRDFQDLGLDCEQMWYLGDAVEGTNRSFIQEMADMHLELLKPLGIPLRYVLGNHDFDLFRHDTAEYSQNNFPFYYAVQNEPGWKTTPSLQSYYFMDELGDYLLVFFSDHCDASGKWISTHGGVHGDRTAYPYGESDYRTLSEKLKKTGKPVIMAGHYAFAGGNRPSELLNQMLPIPDNVIVHFHGHAHIGDGKWAGKDCFRKIGFTENQPLPQINVSSLENERGTQIRSVVLEIYKNGSLGIFFRDHDRKAWAELYLLENKNNNGGMGDVIR